MSGFSAPSQEEFYQSCFIATFNLFKDLRQKTDDKKIIMKELYKELTLDSLKDELKTLVNYYALCYLPSELIEDNKTLLFNFEEITTDNFLAELEMLIQDMIMDKDDYLKEYVLHIVELDTCDFNPDIRIKEYLKSKIDNVFYKEILSDLIMSHKENKNVVKAIVGLQKDCTYEENLLLKKVDGRVILFDLIETLDLEDMALIVDFLKESNINDLIKLDSDKEKIFIPLLNRINEESINSFTTKKFHTNTPNKELINKELVNVVKNMILVQEDISEYRDEKNNTLLHHIVKNNETLSLLNDTLTKKENYQEWLLMKNDENESPYDICVKKDIKNDSVLSLIATVEKNLLEQSHTKPSASIKVNRI